MTEPSAPEEEELARLLTYEPEPISAAQLKPFAEQERPVYYDPTAAGTSGPNLRYPHERAYLSAQRGVFRPSNPLEEDMVRAHLGARADLCRGQSLDEPLVCGCGVHLGNQYVAREHKLIFPDKLHTIRF